MGRKVDSGEVLVGIFSTNGIWAMMKGNRLSLKGKKRKYPLMRY
jgi:hypothetical protein